MKTTYVITDTKNDLQGIVSNIDENNIRITWSNDEVTELSHEELSTYLEENDELEVEEVEVIEEAAEFGDAPANTTAQASIKAHSSADAGNQADGNPKTRLDWIKQIVGSLADLDDNSVEMMAFAAQQGQIGGAPEHATDGQVDGNRNTITMKPSDALGKGFVKTEQDALFGEAGLTEEAQHKVSTLFEAAVTAAVTEEITKLQEQYNTAISTEVANLSDKLVERLVTYTDKVVNEWLEDNRVAVESTLRSELTNEFLEELKTVFERHYVDIPEEKVPVLESIVLQNEKLDEERNTLMKEAIAREAEIKALTKRIELNALSEGLTLPQKQKLVNLTESVAFDSVEDFTKKVNTIKEGFLKEGTKDTGILTENAPVVKETVANHNVDPSIAAVAARI